MSGFPVTFSDNNDQLTDMERIVCLQDKMRRRRLLRFFSNQRISQTLFNRVVMYPYQSACRDLKKIGIPC